jgi:hypothetical protein
MVMLSRLVSRLSLVVIVVIFIGAGLSRPASAATILDRSVTLGIYTKSAVTSQDFKFRLPTTADFGSMVFEYCSDSPSFYSATCAAPAGLDVTAAGLASQTGNIGFSIDNTDTTPNKLVLTRPAVPGNLLPDDYVFSNVTSPSTAGQTVYVKISTHAGTDGSGPTIDTGAVAFAVQNIFNVDAFVPPFLQMCVGVTVAPDCTSIVGDSVDLGILSSTAANKGQSQYAVATNDISGYVVFALGTTMTSGNNVIAALGSPAASFPGTGQYGINLRANLIPAVGQDPVGLGTGVPTANYDIPNRFVFNDGDSISSSPLPSNYNRMTVSYLVNIPKSQPAGIYSTTMTYVATVQF